MLLIRVFDSQFKLFYSRERTADFSTVKSCILITVKPTLACCAYVKNGHTVQAHITSKLSIITENKCTKHKFDRRTQHHGCPSRGVKRPGRQRHHSPPSSAEVMNEWSFSSWPPPIYALIASRRTPLPSPALFIILDRNK
jgi:hypothetical protein